MNRGQLVKTWDAPARPAQPKQCRGFPIEAGRQSLDEASGNLIVQNACIHELRK